jgi:hypothetical protein
VISGQNQASSAPTIGISGYRGIVVVVNPV